MSRSHPLGTICQDGRIVSDPLHPVVLEGGELHPIVNFDFAAIDGPESELSVSLTEMASGLSEILFWLSSSRDPALVAGRVHSLYTWLNPIDEPYKSLSEISRVYNVPRATLSKALVILRDGLITWLMIRLSELWDRLVRCSKHAQRRRMNISCCPEPDQFKNRRRTLRIILYRNDLLVAEGLL